MRIGIYTNILKDEDLKVTKQLTNEFLSRSVELYIYEDLTEDFPSFSTFSEHDRVKLDILITVGGDGTILRIAKWCALRQIPILGVNLGKVGFLTEIEKGNLSILADAITQKKYDIESRSLLTTRLGEQDFFALNEFVISRPDRAKMLMLDVSIHGQRVDSYYCDGFIVSTPTGSTAYSLSAGGPVISPNTKALVVTPINSHSLHSRPIVIGEDETVDIAINSKTPTAMVTGDGIACGILKSGEPLRICKAEIQALFVRLSENNFYSRLLEKLNTWSITPSNDEVK